ncbi:MAG: carbonic anhydrase, partial [Hyphomonadaceae bacterium]|nr:carbonic anhydrase [Hyphomonadaceae bacterium]
MKTPEDLLAGYRRFRMGSYLDHAARFEALDQGQNPDVMLIACCDSRAEPAQIFDAAPGELFVVRNVANLVPPYEDDDGRHGVSAALEFAVTALEVEHIVVMGHGGCGGVAASLAAADAQP